MIKCPRGWHDVQRDSYGGENVMQCHIILYCSPACLRINLKTNIKTKNNELKDAEAEAAAVCYCLYRKTYIWLFYIKVLALLATLNVSDIT